MNSIKKLSILFICIMMFPFLGKTQDKKNVQQSNSNKIEVIDFHSTHRCMTCNAIEANTKYTLKTYFSSEMEKGIITFQSVNVDKKVNFAKAEKFQASGTSLFLNVIIDGNETIVDLTEFAFRKGRDQEAFSKELASQLDNQLDKF